MKWSTQERRVKDLIPTEKNPRTMTEKQNKDLERSLKKFGLVEIPVINYDGVILAGHQRLRVLGLLGKGDEMIEVRVPDRQLTDEEAREYLIRSNKNTGSWDYDMLANSFDMPELIEWGFDERELILDFGSEEVKTPSSKKPNYNIVFENEGQKDKFMQFLELLEQEYTLDGVGERLSAFAEDYLGSR